MLAQLQVTYVKDGKIFTQALGGISASNSWREIEKYVKSQLDGTLISFKAGQ